MKDDEIEREIERLESYVLNPDYIADPKGKDRDHALLELAALRLQNPHIDPSGMKWTGYKLQEILIDHYSGKSPIAIDAGDPRSAYSRNGINKETGLSYPAYILFLNDTLEKNKLRGNDTFDRLANKTHFSKGRVKELYYMALKDNSYKKELIDFYKRFGFPENRRISRKF